MYLTWGHSTRLGSKAFSHNLEVGLPNVTMDIFSVPGKYLFLCSSLPACASLTFIVILSCSAIFYHLVMNSALVIFMRFYGLHCFYCIVLFIVLLLALTVCHSSSLCWGTTNIRTTKMNLKVPLLLCAILKLNFVGVVRNVLWIWGQVHRYVCDRFSTPITTWT